MADWSFQARFFCRRPFVSVRKLSFRENDAFAGCRHISYAPLYFKMQLQMQLNYCTELISLIVTLEIVNSKFAFFHFSSQRTFPFDILKLI